MDAVKKVARGKTFYGGLTPPTTFEGGSIEIEGVEAEFENVAAGQTTQVKVKRDGKLCKARLMRNATASTTLLPGMLVTHKAGYRNRRVGGQGTDVGAECAGVVDDHLPASGCAVGDLCWVFFYGPCNTLKVTGDDLAEGEVVICSATDGKCQAIGTPGDATAAQLAAINKLGRCFADATDPATSVVVDLNIT